MGDSLLRTHPQPECLLCGSAGRVTYPQLQDHLFGVAGSWGLKTCENPSCGLAWLDPMPLTEDLALAYQQYYTHTADAQPRASFWKRLDYGIYRRLNKLLGKLTGLHAQQQRAAQLFLEPPCGKLLDVGCGNGRFLQRMRAIGWEVEGTDFDPKAAAAAHAEHGLTVRVGDLASIAYPDAQFDVVTLQHLIEHVPDPVALLQECRRILKPQGRLVLVTPNLQSWGHQHFAAAWRGLEPPRHLYLYARQNLQNLAARAGFSQHQAFTTATGAEYILGDSFKILAGLNHHSPTHSHLFSKAWLLQYYEFWLLRKYPELGEELFLIAQK
jgi:2-polyprenyl-3-methyl-5-hydroxy-6-metoxy-1,4-benzoquinol methylase